MLGAMPNQQRHPPGLRHGRNLIRQSSLADAGLAGNQEQPPAARGRIVESAQQRRQLAIASHHRARRPGSKPAGANHLWRPDLSDEPVAPCGYSGDETRRIGIVGQGSSDLSDRSVDAVLAVEEDALAPDALQNFLARNQLSAALDQQV